MNRQKEPPERRHLSGGFSHDVLQILAKYGKISSLPLTILATEGGGTVEYIMSLLLSVAANVIANLVCKWLDRQNKEQ